MLSRPMLAFGLAVVLLWLVGCSSPEPTTYTLPSHEELGLQPADSVDLLSAERVRAALFGPEPPVAGLVLDASTSGPQEDVVSAVCGNRRGPGVYASLGGQRKLWTSADLNVESFAGAFGVISAATAVEQVKGRFTCDEYTADADPDARMAIPNQDADGWHRDIRLIQPPALAGVENAVFFCETVKEVNHRCYAALARAEVVSRVTVTARTTARAEEATRSLLDEAARRLVAATAA
ncbi:hypothetical protein [Asanoa iriomotensis]|uniref:PknH-like extracellular domain-containing protein n=1 Tax=Asanoa iriomotensis TaxID=234613 RepID=A0ABQ4BVQ6_9ACTN|nr:hypothetical protein [Asanoa iriomotensis]GIF54236.1 hypothetical protein Air01nite_03310 [Asanoa iriomotensis]